MLAFTIILLPFLLLTSAYMNVHYEFRQDSGIVSSDLKMFCGNEYIDFKHRAIVVNESTLEHEGLTFLWLKAPQYLPGFMYMLKAYSKEVLDIPHELHDTAVTGETFYRPLPCLFDTGAELSIRVKLTNTWEKFMVAIDASPDTRAFKMSLLQIMNRVTFQSSVNNSVENQEHLYDLTPFSTEEEITITLLVKENCIQIQVDGDDFYCYARAPYIIDGFTFVAWRKSATNGMAHIYSYAMRCPSYTI